MEIHFLIGILLIGFTVLAGVVFVYFFFFADGESIELSDLMGRGGNSLAGKSGSAVRNDASEAKLEEFNRGRKKSLTGEVVTLEEKLFRAGRITEHDRANFMRLRVLLPIAVTAITAVIAIMYLSGILQWVALVMGVLLGLQAPYTLLDRWIKQRDEEILYYLPLVIEQIAIGVSSSLDVGPCLNHVVKMADERDSHNPVTILIKFAQNYIKSGVSFEAAMTEVGKLSGHTELKHAFMSLAQVAKHGGEITRQLQELADAVASQRETQIEAKIEKLELEATGPVALVFLGFIGIILIGFFLQLGSIFE